MLARLRRLGGGQFVAAILIFAVMLQSMAVAAAGRLAVDSGGNWPGAEICHHSSPADGDAGAPDGAPERSGAHCIFCLAGAPLALDAPLPRAEFRTFTFTVVPWTFTALRLPALTVDAGARPRGPPRTA
jgi:hypothetical protein